MKKEVGLLLDKSRRSVKAAELLFEKGNPDFAASRAYYAMFYAAEAALLERGETYSKHAGVISGFYHHFVVPKELPQKLHESFHAAFEDRQQGDYAFLDPFPREEAKKLLSQAKQFVTEVTRYLERQKITP